MPVAPAWRRERLFGGSPFGEGSQRSVIATTRPWQAPLREFSRSNYPHCTISPAGVNPPVGACVPSGHIRISNGDPSTGLTWRGRAPQKRSRFPPLKGICPSLQWIRWGGPCPDRPGRPRPQGERAVMLSGLLLARGDCPTKTATGPCGAQRWHATPSGWGRLFRLAAEDQAELVRLGAATLGPDRAGSSARCGAAPAWARPSPPGLRRSRYGP